MSVAPQTPFNVSTGNGASTVYPYTFEILQASDLAVYIDGNLKVLNVDYTVSGAGVVTGGNVTFGTAPANGTKVTLTRQMLKQRLTDYQQLGDFLTPVVNPDFDRAILISQELSAADSRSIRVAAYEQSSAMLLPPIATRKSQVLGFDVNGDVTVLTTVPTGPPLSQATIGGYLFPQTQAEAAAGVTPTKLWYPPNDLGRYGGVDDDATDNTAAINSAIAVGGTIRAPCRNLGIYRTAGGHTLSDGVSVKGDGRRTGAPYHGSGFKLTANAIMFTGAGRNTIEDLEFTTTTTSSPFTSAGTAISMSTSSTFAGHIKISRCRIVNYHVGIKVGGALWGTVEECGITNNNYGVTYDMTGAVQSNAMLWLNNQIALNQRGGVVAISMPGRGIGHTFIGGSIESNCSENPAVYTYQIGGFIAGQISFRNVYMEYAFGATAAPDFINASGMSQGSIKDCYFNLSTSTSGTGIISSGAGSSYLTISGNRFLGANFTKDVDFGACTAIRVIDNTHSGAPNTVTGTGSQIITTRLAPTIARETSFTPVAQGTGTAGTQTYSVQQGYYTQVDNLVHFRLRITMTAKDGATAGNLQIGGLPVAAAASANGFATFAVAVENLTQSASRTQFVGRLAPSGTAIDIMESGSNVPLLATVVANLQATTSLYCTGKYSAASPA
jgi:hypothetical protein